MNWERDRRRMLIGAAGILLSCLIAYWPALRGGFVWDDDRHVSNNLALRSIGGLGRIWFSPGTTPQYYPLTHTTFWIEYHLWGDDPTGYHIVNVLLHALAAILLWRLLHRLDVPGAFVAAMIFALHPLQVESVAWISERKNVLSTVFYLAALKLFLEQCGEVLVTRVSCPCEVLGTGKMPVSHSKYLGVILRYCHPERTREGSQVDWGHPEFRDASRSTALHDGCAVDQTVSQNHANQFSVPARGDSPVRHSLRAMLPLLFFIAALLSKTVACSMPAVALVLVWWKRGRIGRGDFLRLLPYFVIGLIAAVITTQMEREHVGAVGPDWNFSPMARVLIAGRAVWFYAAKLFWPVNLTFSYPRWTIDSSQPWQYAYPSAVVVVIASLWFLRRRIGRGPLAAVLIFIGVLAPALGFVNTYPMRYSFVADHFQYVAGIALIAGCVTLWVGMVPSFSPSPGTPGEGWGEGFTTNTKTLTLPLPAYRARGKKSIAKCHTPLIAWCVRTVSKLIRQFPSQVRITLAILPIIALAVLTFRQSRIYAGPATIWRDVIAKNPSSWMAHHNLAVVLSLDADPTTQVGRTRLEESLVQFDQAEALRPQHERLPFNRGDALAKLGRYGEAIASYEQGLARTPISAATLRTIAAAHLHIGMAQAQLGQTAQAISQFNQAIDLQPRWREPYQLLSDLYERGNRIDDAIATDDRLLQVVPDKADALLDAARRLDRAGRDDAAIKRYTAYVNLRPDDAQALAVLGVLYGRIGRFDEAAASFSRALEIDPTLDSARRGRSMAQAMNAQRRTPASSPATVPAR